MRQLCSRLLFFFSFCLALGSTPIWAATRQSSETAFSAGRYNYGYLLFLPPNYQTDSSARWPLMVFLHGSGQVGTNLDSVAAAGPPQMIEQGRNFPCIVISPQSPSYGWDPVALDAFIKDLSRQYRVDSDRIYVTGLSMGGYGTWNLATYDPSLCAAIVPLCGGGTPSLAPLLKDLPVWAFHGALDTTVPASATQAMIDGIQQAGGNPRLTIYPTLGHSIWNETYSNERVYEWLFAQSRATDPVIVKSPEPISSAIGSHAVFPVVATGSNLSYKWFHNGAEIPGAVEATLFIENVKATDAGLYQAVVSNFRGSVKSTASALYAEPAIDSTRLSALSVRALAGTGERTLIMGLVVKDLSNWIYPAVIGADGPKLPVLLRGVGPSLANLNVTGVMNDPELVVFRGQNAGSSNDNWGGNALVSRLGTMRGLQPIPVESRDAALLDAYHPGTYTVHVRPVAGTTEGVVLSECYEVNGGLAENTPRLHALSARAQVAPGDGTLIVGFVITGSAPLKVLIRAVGPGLSQQGLTSVLADPLLSLQSGGRVLAQNDDWNNDPAIAAAAQSAGLSSLQAGSKDAALLMTLQPGWYTALISGKQNASGVALVELYSLEK